MRMSSLMSAMRSFHLSASLVSASTLAERSASARLRQAICSSALPWLQSVARAGVARTAAAQATAKQMKKPKRVRMLEALLPKVCLTRAHEKRMLLLAWELDERRFECSRHRETSPQYHAYVQDYKGNHHGRSS